MLQPTADDADRSYPRTAGPDERFVDLTPDLLEGVTAASVHAAVPARRHPEAACRASISFHVAPIRASVADAVEELLDELPRVGRISLPPSSRADWSSGST